MTNIFASSERLINPHGKKTVPFEHDLSMLEIGQSIALAREYGTLKRLRMKIYRLGKQMDKKFRIVDHGNNQPYEVGRIG